MFERLVRRYTALFFMLAASAVGATPVTYDVVFTETYTYSGDPTTQSASFVFDSTTQLFSKFLFKFQGNTFDVTAAANSAYPQPCDNVPIVGSLGFAIMSGATDCTYNQNWFVYTPTRGAAELSFFAASGSIDNPISPGPGPTIDTTIRADDLPPAVAGRFSLIAEPSGTVPEPGSVALLSVGLLAAANGARRGRPGRR